MKLLLPLVFVATSTIHPVINLNNIAEKTKIITDADIFSKNIVQLQKITKEEIKRTLHFDKKNTVFKIDKIFDLMKFKGVIYTEKILKFFKNFTFENLNIEESLEKMFTDKKLRLRGQFRPITFWYTYITGYWIANFDNEMSKEIAGGTEIGSDQMGIISEATSAIPGIGGASFLTSAFLSGLSSIFSQNNQGNGVYINFLIAVPVGWGPSTESWS
ncbi:hypothetical protein SSABA_v1c04420 [Spiroplasma sabaudiense Ar-1343]|uniref:Uncharacterized protein n=1 Tax=Spiroplasma sabaudiense Ar-1343 TaxID=1276257 RepID=W6AJF5_9MOLU|nr:hypothetical protein [Spiroplasma sabaudiense]AHI53849.1 hypothetical protein SSABA_v1c04420 [Spiroplasma sabaudiense Ar-1343]